MTAIAQQLTTPGQSLVLHNVSWSEYVRLGRILGERPLRITYDRGTLEIMTLSSKHERLKHLMGRLLEALSEELDKPIAGFGSMTCKRRDKRRGFEPDECYWVANEALVRGKDRIDFRIDPPPDLSLEVDVTSSSLDRMGIYAALRVPEVWRFDGKELTFYGLQDDGKYAVIAESLAFPGLAAADLVPFLTMRGLEHENNILRAFREWVRKHFSNNTPKP